MQSLYVSQNRKKFSFFALIAFLLGVALMGFGVIYVVTSDNVSPEDSSALFGGVLDNDSYNSSGFLLAYNQFQAPSICGTVYLTPNLAISAAHCFDNKINTFLGYSTFNFVLGKEHIAADVVMNPLWSSGNVKGDIAAIRLPDEFPTPIEYARLGSPEVGCGYEVLAYGRSEEEATAETLTKFRKRGEFCIESIEQNNFRMRGVGSGICFGDSGSPIYKKDTNVVVGLVSSIIADSTTAEDPCFIDNKVLAVRVDRNVDFITQVQENRFETSNFAACGETCGSNNKCSFGLACQNGTCFPKDGNCLSNSGEYCSDLGGIICAGDTVCSLNTCADATLANQQIKDVNTATEVTNAAAQQTITNGTYFVAAGGISMLGAIGFFLISRFS